MTRFVAIGDIHEHPGPRNADRLRALDQILDEGLQVPALGAWLLAGDLFHAKSTVEGRNAFDMRLQRMAAAAPVLMAAGNHDERGDLDGFTRLKAPWPITVCETPRIVRLALATGQAAAIFVLPYPSKAGLVAAGVAPGDVVELSASLLDPIFMEAAAALQQARAGGALTLMLAHANVAGAIASAGQPQWGREIDITASHLGRLGPILKLFGHIHRPQEILGAIQIGSVCRLDYGEIEEKRYVVATLADDSSYTLESRPIAVAPMVHLEGLLTREGFTPDAAIAPCAACGGSGEGARGPHGDVWPCETCAGTGDRSWAGCDVRVRYRYHASERSVLPDAALRTRFASALRLKVESVAMPDREVRAPEVAAARTLPDKIAAYRQDDTLPAALAAKIEALEQQEPGDVLRDVADQLATIAPPAQDSDVAA